MTYRQIFWLLIVLALVGYSLPWVVTPGVSTSLGAYDLAEWASLHPAARGAALPLVASFVLRLPLALLALIISVAGERAGSRWVRGLGVLVLTAALLPPLEFFTQYRDDSNYRQQFGLALLTLIGSLIGLNRRLSGWAGWLISGLALLGVVASLWGAGQAYGLLADFHLSVSTGLGVFGIAGSFALLGLLHLSPARRIPERNRAARA